VRTTLALTLCLFALAMACSRTMPSGYRSAYEETLPEYGITETVHYSHVDAGLNERQ
jgi:hypothetical protein